MISGDGMKDGRDTCPFCGKLFLKRNLIRHLRIHTGERPYACSLCSYRATQKVTLQKHMETHNIITPQDHQQIHEIILSQDNHFQFETKT